MGIINKYIFREGLIYFAITLFAFTGILLTLRMLKFAALVINRGVDFSQIGMLFVSIIPTFLEVALPLSALLGVMLAFGRLSGDSEIIVLRSSGISIFALIKPVAVFGALGALLTLAISLYASPWGYASLSNTLFQIASSQSLAGLEPGVFNKLGSLVLYTEKIDYAGSHLDKVLIDDKRSPDARRIITAAQGRIFSDAATQSIVFELKDGFIHEQIQGKYVITRFENNTLLLDSKQMFQADEAKRGTDPRELSLAALTERHSELKDLYNQVSVETPPSENTLTALKLQAPDLANASLQDLKFELNKKIARLETEQHRRLSMPFAALILALLGLPLGIQVPRTQRTWGIGICFSLGMFVFVLYYALFSLGVGLAENGRISSWLALWLPNFASVLITSGALFMISTEKWHSIPHAIESISSGLVSKYLERRSASAQ